MPDVSNVPEPADDLADLSDEQQVELIESTDNSLTEEDEALPQPDVQPAAPVGEG